MFPLGNKQFRLIASHPLSEASTGSMPGLEELRKIYDMRSHIPAKLSTGLERRVRINSRMISELQEGRIFFGGDAAHIHSPAGAQGMNTGIQDMINLSWKLAMVMQGTAQERLLATYGEERIPVIREVLKQSARLTDAVGSENAIFRGLFNHIAPLIAGTQIVQEQAIARISQIALNYRDSSFSETHAHQGSLRGGDRIPDIRVNVMNQSGQPARNLFSLLDPTRFTLFFTNVKDASKLHQDLQAYVSDWRGFIEGHWIEADVTDHRRFEEKFGRSPMSGVGTS